MKITKEHIQKYLHGKANAAEVDAIHKALNNNQIDLDDWFPESEWRDMTADASFERNNLIKQSVIKKIKTKHRQRHIYELLKYAAVLVVIGAIGWASIPFWEISKQAPQITEQPLTNAPKLRPPSNLYYINSGNMPTQIDVPDGSKIDLYPNSEVKFLDNFSAQPVRDIHLKGKAKFSVAKDKSKPFIVHSTGLTTTALGTVFSVDEQQSTAVTKVKLFEGRIQVMGLDHKLNTQPLNLEFVPNEEITINHEKLQILAEARMNTSAFNRKGFYLEKQNTLIFKNLALKDILHIISQNYKVKLEFNSEAIEDKYYSGTYHNDPSIFKKILSDIQELHHIIIKYTE